MIPLSNRAPSGGSPHWRPNRPWCLDRHGNVTRRPKLSQVCAKNRPSAIPVARRMLLSHERSLQSSRRRVFLLKNKRRKIRKQIERENHNARKTHYGSSIKSCGEKLRRVTTSNTYLRRLTLKRIRSTSGSGTRRKRLRKIRSWPHK